MSENAAVRFGEKPGETATLLLAAAEELDLDPSVVQVHSDTQMFVVPEEVQKKAGLDKADGDKDEESKPKTTKKTAAKKAEK
jgi:hypothetical protein